ncbi:DUF262 domain-containing protein [Neotabrizicola sp. sgz301269]|uniref:GmrSD restriction endonuclease domain-containing protein n=1 Tax=Neotabrizicola sp. sgz301269 TaxID=3276282 RepID=UPI00376F5B36
MVKRVVLDAMIKRADFAHQSESVSVELSNSLKLSDIAGSSPMSKLLRKPDFQRETNHWSPAQVVSLIKSFVSGELIPAIILWKSESFIFVIDGGHRLSALRAWAENDYGDGSVSYGFYDRNIPQDQKDLAKATRRAVESEVGRYSDFYSLSEEQLAEDAVKAKQHSTIFSRSLHVQWIQGNQEVAESSFFKINSQGTALDQTEELLLRNRRKSYAVAARSIVRAGTGHKYWSTFSPEIQSQIENYAQRQNDIFFQPDATEPIKTLDLPLGGTSSPIDALKTLVDIFGLVDQASDIKKRMNDLADDIDGTETVSLLRRSLKVASRMSGNDPGSLGLHPAVYFYTERGKHSRFLFLGVVKSIANAIANNNKEWFRSFTKARARIESTLIDRKSLINQGLANVNSSQRVDRISDLMNYLIQQLQDKERVSDVDILRSLGLEGAAGDLRIIDAPEGFSVDVKSAVFLQSAIVTAPRCEVCGGLLHVIKSASYDHKEPVHAGGKGTLVNAQILHPYCNTGIKGGLEGANDDPSHT